MIPSTARAFSCPSLCSLQLRGKAWTARIWQATTEKEAQRRQRQFSRKWEARQPMAVATVRRDFEATVTFYHIQAAAALRGIVWPAHRLRTTSPLERKFRAFRRRFPNTVLFHSPSGLKAVVHQLLIRRTTDRANALPLTWQLTLERSLAQVCSIS